MRGCGSVWLSIRKIYANLVAELAQKIAHKDGAPLSLGASGLGCHCGGQTEQLGKKVIN